MRRSLALLGAVALAAALSFPVSAAPVTLYAVPQQVQTYRVVEQQSPLDPWPPDACISAVYEGIVCNRTVDPVSGDKCIWDVDDHVDIYFAGSRLGPGEEASWSHCLIADSSHLYGMKQGDHDMTLTITIEAGGVSKSVSTTGPGLCMQGMIVKNDSPLREVIPDSDGGTGILGSITFSVRNDTGQTERYGPSGSQTAAGSGLRGSSVYEDRWCPSGYWLSENGEESFDPLTRTGFLWELP